MISHQVPYLFYILFFLVGAFSLSIYGQCLAHTNDHISPRQYVAAGSSLILINGVGAAFGPFMISIFMQVMGTQAFFPTLSIIFLAIFAYGLHRTQMRAPVPLDEQGESYLMPARSSPIVMNIMEESAETLRKMDEEQRDKK